MGRSVSRERLIKIFSPQACSPPIGYYNPKEIKDAYSNAIMTNRKHNKSSVLHSEDKEKTLKYTQRKNQFNKSFQNIPISCKRHMLISNINKVLNKRNKDCELVLTEKEDEDQSTFASKSIRIEPPQPINIINDTNQIKDK